MAIFSILKSASIRPQAPDGIGEGGFNNLKAYRAQGDHHRAESRYCEDPSRNARPILIIIQPGMHNKIGYWRGDQQGYDDHHYKVF
jgi:hypothetical protein